jgi:hypothetical protein
MNNKQLKLSIGGHLRMLWLTLLIFIALGVLVISTWEPTKKFILIIFGIYFIMFILPAIYIHYIYYIHSKGISYEINKNTYVIKFDNTGEKKVEVEEFMNFTLVATKSKLAGTVNSFLFSNYYYVILQLKNNEKLIFTCLYNSELDVILKSCFPNTPMKTVDEFYPIIGQEAS